MERMTYSISATDTRRSLDFSALGLLMLRTGLPVGN